MKTLVLGIAIASLLLFLTVGTAVCKEESAVLYFSFDKGTGDTAKDLSGNGNHGTIHGAKWENRGKINSALSFDGDDWVEVPHSESLSFTKEITVMAWVNYTGTTSVAQIVSKGYDPTCQFELDLSAANDQIEFQFYDGTDWIWIPVKPLPPREEWHHIAGTFDGKALKIYLDGAVVGELEYGGEIPENELPVAVGKRVNPEQHFMDGMIDEVGIFNRALTEKEIKKAMEGISSFLVVEPQGKLASRWGKIKTSYYGIDKH